MYFLYWFSKMAETMAILKNQRFVIKKLTGKLDCKRWTWIQFSSAAQLCPTLCDPVDCSTPGLPIHYQLLEFTQTHVHWVGDAIQPFHPLSSPSPPAFNLLQHQGLFQRVSSSHQVAKYWSFSFNISPSNEHPGLISFRMDWLQLLAVQGTLKSLLQHHSSKASILQRSAFFIGGSKNPQLLFYPSYQLIIHLSANIQITSFDLRALCSLKIYEKKFFFHP